MRKNIPHTFAHWTLIGGVTVMMGCSRGYLAPDQSTEFVPPIAGGQAYQTEADAPTADIVSETKPFNGETLDPAMEVLPPIEVGMGEIERVENSAKSKHLMQEAPSVFSESAAVCFGMLHSPMSYRSQAALESAAGLQSEMRAELLPSIALQAEAGRADRLSSNRQDDPADAGIGVFLRQRLFDGRAGWFRYLSSKHQSKAKTYEREAAKNRVAAEISLGFARMRHCDRIAKAQREEVESVEALSGKLALLTAYGVATSETLARLRAQQQNLRAGAQESLAKLQGERRDLLELMGAPAGSRFSLGETRMGSIDEDPSMLASQAMEQRAELKAAEYAVQAKRASVESVRRERYPSADLILGVATEGRLDESVRDTWQTAGRIGIRAEWNGIDFGRNEARKRQELATLREAESDYLQLKRTVQHDIVNAVESIKLAFNQVNAATDEMREAGKSLSLALEAFHNDAGDIETVIRAHRSVRQSKFSESTAQFRVEEGKVLLSFSQGTAGQVEYVPVDPLLSQAGSRSPAEPAVEIVKARVIRHAAPAGPALPQVEEVAALVVMPLVHLP